MKPSAHPTRGQSFRKSQKGVNRHRFTPEAEAAPEEKVKRSKKNTK